MTEVASDGVSVTSTSRRMPPPAAMPIVAAVLVALVVGLFASAFLWPLKASSPHGIPFGVAGSTEQIAQMSQQLSAAQPDLFDVKRYDDRDAVVDAIERRDIAGGLVLGPEGAEVLTASAGGPQITQMLSQKALAFGAVTTDVVSGGAMAAGANLVMLPSLIGGMVLAVLSYFFIRRPLHRIVAVLAGSALAGLVAAAVFGPWFGILPGHYWMHAVALGMGILAIGATISGLATVLGRVGLGIGVIVMMLIGSPWGGMLAPREFLPGFTGWLGAHLPNGNVISVMQNINFFPKASQAGQWWVFVTWAAIGLVLLGVGALRQPSSVKAGHAIATS